MTKPTVAEMPESMGKDEQLVRDALNDYADSAHNDRQVNTATMAQEAFNRLMRRPKDDGLREALQVLQKLGEEGMELDYTKWLTFHDKVAEIAKAALSRTTDGGGE